MQTVKVSVLLPDATHPQMELHVSSNDSDCNVVIELPMRERLGSGDTADAPRTEADEYQLGGYAGI